MESNMSALFQVTFDCADPASLSRFWVAALDYKLQNPPPGFSSWEEWLRQSDIPEAAWNDVSIAVDPEGTKPNLYFQKVPEGKIVKNRLHLDIKISPGPGTAPPVRAELIAPKVAQLTELGATKLRVVEEHGSYWVVMADPEGNEFCLT
jgi:hypothetical protein